MFMAEELYKNSVLNLDKRISIKNGEAIEFNYKGKNKLLGFISDNLPIEILKREIYKIIN